MATRIEHRATFPHSAADTFAAQTDERALWTRLRQVGGKNAQLRDHAVTPEGARYTLVQGIGSETVPALVRTIHSGDLAVRRHYVWHAADDRYTGTVTVDVADLPGRLAAEVDITPTDTGCVQRTHGEVSVRVPLVGGKIERVVVEQVTALLAREAELTEQWLAG